MLGLSPISSHPESAFPGYTLQDNGALQPSFDANGEVLNPDATAELNRVCDKCMELLECLPGYVREREGYWFDLHPFHTSKSAFRDSVMRGCGMCAQLWAFGTADRVGEDSLVGLLPENDASNYVHCAEVRLQYVKNDFSAPLLVGDHSSDVESGGEDEDGDGDSEDEDRGAEEEDRGEESSKKDHGEKGSSKEEPSKEESSKEESSKEESGTDSSKKDSGREPFPIAKQVALDASNDSKASWEIIAGRLSKCSSEHDWCSATEEEITEPPTRVLFISDDEPSRIRLISCDKRIRWVTLSHCWGEPHEGRLILTNSTLEHRMTDGYDIRELPQLFRDCAKVTRKLGFNYLWIDSLCIIQDSSEDCARETGRMGDVYRGSAITIAAVSAPNSLGSLFTKVHPLISASLVLEGPDMCFTVFQVKSVKSSPLHDRAWVLQERLLAPRTVLYYNTGIEWHCGESATMKLDDGMGSGDRSFGVRSWEDLLEIDATTVLADIRDVRAGQGLWTDLLADYHRLKLTYERDRPRALEGIISILRQDTGLKMVAGICEQFMPYSLLWRVRDESKRYIDSPATFESWRKSLGGYPSWSCSFRHAFADLYTGIHLGFCGEASIASDPEPTLTVKGRHAPMTLFSVPDGDMRRPRGKKLGVSLSPDQHFMLQKVEGHWMSNYDVLSRLGLLLWLDFVVQDPIEVELVPLTTGREAVTYRHNLISGLVLAKFDREADSWERVGVFRAPGPTLSIDGMLARFGAEKEYKIR